MVLPFTSVPASTRSPSSTLLWRFPLQRPSHSLGNRCVILATLTEAMPAATGATSSQKSRHPRSGPLICTWWTQTIRSGASTCLFGTCSGLTRRSVQGMQRSKRLCGSSLPKTAKDTQTQRTSSFAALNEMSRSLDAPNFGGFPASRSFANKRPSPLVCRFTPEPGGPSRDDYRPPDGYKLAYSMPCANPYHHLPKETPRLHTPVHVTPDVAPERRALALLQICVPYNQD